MYKASKSKTVELNPYRWKYYEKNKKKYAERSKTWHKANYKPRKKTQCICPDCGKIHFERKKLDIF